ncbi:MAG: glycine cleavage system protein H [Candidatus Bathyarchaeia archaeon]
MTSERNIRVGLSQYAQERLEGIAYIYIDPQKKEVAKMEQFGVIETWLFMFNLHSPVSGKIVKFNENLRNNPHLINKDPYNEGWIVETQVIAPLILEQELKDLLTSRQYHKWVSKLENRLKVK